MVELVVSEQHLDEEDPADEEEDHLAGEHDHCVPQQLHGGEAVIWNIRMKTETKPKQLQAQAQSRFTLQKNNLSVVTNHKINSR